ncbi:MAG: alpha/beta hydrolase, partial [Proteobacteria bacterium]|nr:alpha/beta hydrolase [Pseudomonadota bacterium]
MKTLNGSKLGFFPGFKPIRIATSGAEINGVIGGSGPPLLLLHGWPQSHVEWHRVAPVLARHFTVIATDLRGYGDSSIPAEGSRHEGYSKREMARDQIEVMRSLGFDRFAVAGHDRGARVGQRMAMDYPDAVTRLALIDVVPAYTLYTHLTKEFATVYYHWFLLVQPSPLPETILGNSAEFFLRTWAFSGLIPEVITAEAFAEYLRCFKNPATLHAMCEDYRAGATIDLEHEKIECKKKMQCPLLVLWGGKGAMGLLYDVLAQWQDRALHVRGKAFDGGHWLP